MKTENEIRADFKSAWQQGEWQNLHTNPDDGFKIWQTCQQLNDEVIAAKDASVEELEAHMKELACKLFHECIPANLAKDAEIAKLREAFKEAIKGLRKFEYIYEGEHGFVYHNEQSAIDKFNELLNEE